MKSIAIRRLGVVPVPRGAGLSRKHKLTMLAELSQLGVRVQNPELLDATDESFLLDYHATVSQLRAMRGGDVDYVPLFAGFPNDVPDDDIYFAQRLIGYVGNAFGLFDEGKRLEHGVVVPPWLFELEEFGADPITQLQTLSQWQRGKLEQAKRQQDQHAQWTSIELVPADEVPQRLSAWLVSCLYAKSSIKEALHADLRQLLRFFGVGAIDFDRVVHKESRALVLRTLWEAEEGETAMALAATATDILRLFAALTESDVSLAAPIRFPKLSRKQRRWVLASLERCSSLAEDLKRYRGLWLAVGRYLHPGEHGGAYPRVAAAFDALRNGKIATFDSRTEALMRDGDVGAVLAHLARRPGTLGRRVHELLRRFPEGTGAILDAFATLAGRMTVKNLLVVRSYFATINGDPCRTVINKRGRIKVLDNNARGALSQDTLALLDSLLEDALRKQLAARESWAGKAVWIDPALARLTVPMQQRAASDGLLAFGRGSRIPVQLGRVLRLFVYWKQSQARTDLDLSVIQLDDEFRYCGRVSYTKLADSGIVHSGDIQSAPHGAAEFIDITLDCVKEETRYLAVQVYRFCGEAFSAMRCHAGWMVRERVDASYKSFDVRTVENMVDLSGTGAYCIPLVVDRKAGEIVLTDLYVGGLPRGNNVEGAYANVALAAREISRFTETRPTMLALAELHRSARGGRVASSADDADISLGVDGCTFNAVDVEQVLSELL